MRHKKGMFLSKEEGSPQERQKTKTINEVMVHSRKLTVPSIAVYGSINRR